MTITALKLVTGYYLGVGTPSIASAVTAQIASGWVPVGAPQLTDTYGQCAQTMVQTTQPGATAYTAVVATVPTPPDATWDPLGAAVWVDTTTWLQVYTKGNQYVAPISLTTQIAGILGITNGGTGASNAAGARDNLQARYHNTTPLGAVDLNTLQGTSEGNYRFTTGPSLALNFPEAVGGILNVFQISAAGTTGCLQFYTTYTAGKTYVRSFSTVWTSWVALVKASDIIPIAQGGTGAQDAANARSNLGIGTIGTLSTVTLTSDVSGILPLVNGGTGANNAATARANLGVGTIGTLNIVSLTTNVTGTLPVANGGTGSTTAAGARSNLGVGTIGTLNTVSLTTNVTGTLPVANGGTGATDATTARTNLGVGTIGTLNSVDLTTNVTGLLPLVNGGTGANNATTARTNLGLGTAATKNFAPSLDNVMLVGYYNLGTPRIGGIGLGESGFFGGDGAATYLPQAGSGVTIGYGPDRRQQIFTGTSSNLFVRNIGSSSWDVSPATVPWVQMQSVAPSDINIKHINGDLDVEQSLSNINALEFKNFYYLKDEDQTPRRGVIAQQAQEVDPEYVHDAEGVGMMTLDANPLLMDALAAIKALTVRCENLQAQVDTLKTSSNS
nr:MAG: chaperone of endosialidase [Bacteriophage sp.]